MVNLNENRLRQLLGNINQNPQMKDQYESKWHSVVHFLYNNVGYKIAKVAKAGSQAKHTESRNSDLERKELERKKRKEKNYTQLTI